MKPKLIGSYSPPNIRAGEPVEVVRYDRESGDAETVQVYVTGFSTGRIRWPTGRLGDQPNESVLLCGDLARAVATESVTAICYYWGVSRWTVQRWRRALGVEWYTAGTQAAWSAAWKRRQQYRFEGR